MNNLTLRNKLNFLRTSILLFILFALLFMAYAIGRAPDVSAGRIVGQMLPFLAVSIFYVLFVISFSANIQRSLSEPLESLEGILEKLSEGDFFAKADDTADKLQEEYGDLTRAIDKIRGNVGGLIDGISRESEAISKAVGGVRSHMGGMSQELEDIFIAAEELSDSLKAAGEAADKIGGISDDIEGAAGRMAARAKDGMEWAAEIRKRALYAKETALDKSEAVRLGKKDIRDSLAKTLNDAKIIEQISVLAESVVEITEQVNLLSLNAGLEAARAGEAGSEFVKIAEEIRSLTDQSKKYAENIQWAVDEVTSVLVNLRKDAKRLLDFIDRDVFTSFNMFVRIADTYNSDAGEMNFMASDVGAASEELLVFAGRISDSLEEIKTAAGTDEEGAAGIADRSVRTAARVSAMEDDFKAAEDAAGRLAKDVGRFKIKSR